MDENKSGTASLNGKLLKIKKSLPYFKKTGQGHNCTYVPGVDILLAIQDRMNELGVLLYPEVNTPTVETISGVKNIYNTKTKSYYEKHFIYHILSASGYYVWEDIESGVIKKVPWIFCADKDDVSQAFGTALTYSERYFLLKFFNIPTDNLDADHIKNAKKKSKGLEQSQIKVLNNLMSKAIPSKDSLEEFWVYISAKLNTDYSEVLDIRQSDYTYIVDVLNKKIEILNKA